jgi:hypothetical protein
MQIFYDTLNIAIILKLFEVITIAAHEVKVFYIKYTVLKCDFITSALIYGVILLILLLHEPLYELDKTE